MEAEWEQGPAVDRALQGRSRPLLQTSGCRQRQIAGDLGISVSALGRWAAELRAEDLPVRMRSAKEITAYPESVIWPVRNVIC